MLCVTCSNCLEFKRGLVGGLREVLRARRSFRMVAVRLTLGGLPSALPQGARYLIVDRHSIILAYPELRKLHERSAFAARQELTMRLRHYQDWTGVCVVIVFDGK